MQNLYNLAKAKDHGNELNHEAASIILGIGIFCIVLFFVIITMFIFHIKRVSAKEKKHNEAFRRAFWWDEPMKFWSFYVYAFTAIAALLAFIICLIISIPFL